MQEVDLKVNAGGQRSEEVRGGTGRMRRKEEEEGGKQTAFGIYFTKSPPPPHGEKSSRSLLGS